MKSLYKNLLLIFVLLLIYSSICAFSYVNAVSSSLSNAVFRLHVLANSDSQEDQSLKYLVRDELISYLNSISKGVTSKQEVIDIANLHITEFEKIARDVTLSNGFNYDVKVNIGTFAFPEKQYGDISLPSGYYDAIRVEIGEAKGNNWWCVLFPPLCFVDVSSGIIPEDSKQIMKDSLSDEEYALISEDSENIKFKFKLFELFQSQSFRNSKKIVVNNKFLCYIVIGCIYTLYFLATILHLMEVIFWKKS